MKTSLFLIVVLFMGIIINVSGQNSVNDEKSISDQKYVRPTDRGVRIDTNNDGVCDKFDIYGAPGRGLGPGKGQGLASMRYSSRGCGYGRGLRGRGIRAGQYTKAGNRSGYASGQGRGLGPGLGSGIAPGGRFYSDDNKNEICDTYERNFKR